MSWSNPSIAKARQEDTPRNPVILATCQVIEKKVAFVRAFMQELGLSYEPGTTWNARGRFVLYSGLAFGFSITVSFEYMRHGGIDGLVVYHFCIEIEPPSRLGFSFSSWH